MNEPLHGVLTRAGTFPVRDQEVTGYVVETLPAELKAMKTLPMLRQVAIVPEAALSFQHFEHVLKKHRLIDPAALDDPEGYDNYRTHGAIHAAHRELFGHE